MLNETKTNFGIVSLLVPLYNHENFIAKALDSVLASDCSKIELIVSDDASSDNSAKNAANWIDNNGGNFFSAKLFVQKGNLGINGNLNYLIRVASGEYVTLLASDDELATRAIDIQRKFLEKKLDVDFVFANCGILDANNNIVVNQVVGRRRALFFRWHIFRLMNIIFSWGLPWSTRLFGRRAAVLSLGPYPEDLSCEDRWLVLKIAQTQRLTYLNDVVYFYRHRANGTGTANLDPGLILADTRAAERLLLAECTGMLRVFLQVWTRTVHPEYHRRSNRLFFRILGRLIRSTNDTLMPR